jgi:heme/copper-type cytochrome/quinol oxidase subunit 3
MSAQVETVDFHEIEKATLEGRNKVMGFWLFLGGEVVLFGTLFSAYLGLKDKTMVEELSAYNLFELPLIAIATLILLTSSLFTVLAVQAMHRGNVKALKGWLLGTVLLGVCFLGLEIFEFSNYAAEGLEFRTSAFSSAFYSLVGTHGGHVFFGILWIGLLIWHLAKRGLNTTTGPKVYIASMYWHFIDVVWVFIFTVVYLMGKVA